MAVLFPGVCESCILVIESCLCLVLYHITSEFMLSDINFGITHDLYLFTHSFLSLLSHFLLRFYDIIMKKRLTHLSDELFAQKIYWCWLWHKYISRDEQKCFCSSTFKLVQTVWLNDFYIANLSSGKSLGLFYRAEKISFIWRQSHCKKQEWVYMLLSLRESFFLLHGKDSSNCPFLKMDLKTYSVITYINFQN